MRDLEKEFGHLFKTASIEKDANPLLGMLGSWGKSLGSTAMGWGKSIGNSAAQLGQKARTTFNSAMEEGKAGFNLARTAAPTKTYAGNQTAFNTGMNSMLKGYGTAAAMGGAGLMGVNAIGNAIWGAPAQPQMPKMAADFSTLRKSLGMFGNYAKTQAKNHIPELAGIGLAGAGGIYLGNKIRENSMPAVDLLPYLEAREKILPPENIPEVQ